MPDPLEIIHEDARLLAVSKDSGMAVAGGAGAEITLRDLVAEHVGGKAYLVHRLDRGTSGVIVFAKDAESHRHLSSLFETRGILKRYVAIVSGHVDPPTGTLTMPLRAFGSGRMGVQRGGKEAMTEYTVTDRLDDVDALEVRTLTGRRHQVRVHLYAIGHPVLGDTLYGDPRPVGGAERLMLHASELTLPEPDGGSLVLRADPPSDFREIADRHWAAG